MPFRYLKYLCLLLLLFQSSFVIAQGDDLQAKLNSFKAKNDLSNWIYEQLDYANYNPKLATTSLQNAQKTKWRATKTNEEHFAWLNLLSTLGYYQLLDGDIIGSINAYESALSFFKKHQVLDYDIVEYTFKPLSNNYTRVGDYERALYIQKQSIAFQQKYSEDSNKTAAIYCNMAISYRSMAKLEDAYKAIEMGLALKPDQFNRIMLNNVYADVLYDDENYAKAAAVIENNISKQKASNTENAYWLMSSYTTAGNIYLQQQNNGKANVAYLKALQLLDQYYPYSRIRERANLYTQIGATYLAQDKAKEAISFGQKTLSTLDITSTKTIYGDNKLVEVFMLIARANLELKQPEKALKNINLSLLSADKIRHEFAADRTKERLQSYLKQIAEQGIEISYQLYEQTRDKKYLQQILTLAEQSKSRTLLDKMQRNQQSISKNIKSDRLFIKKQKLERHISYLEKQMIEEPNSSSTKDVEALKYDLALLNKALSKKYQYLNTEEYQTKIQIDKLPNHRFIEYFIGEHHVYIININQNKIEGVVKLADAEKVKSALRSFVQTYFHNGPNAMLNNPKAFFQASHDIYQLILAPIHIKPNEQLTIIPDGMLGYLSFDGLITQNSYTENISKWPFLIKNHATDYAFSIQTLQAKKKVSSSGSFAGLFITHSDSEKTALKAITTEADLIREHVSGDFIFDDDVNPKSFEQLFTTSKVMHIGTHAYLTGVNNEPTLDFGKEKMYLFELSAKQSAPSLVVLSACQTADGVLANGEGIISLSRGFNAIGTAATIASLWNVNDDAAAQIMASFYQSLEQTKNASEALRLAKLNWINTAKTSNAVLLPYYWDSLIYMGKNQEIELSKPINWLVYGSGFALLFIGIAAYLGLKKRKTAKSISL
ncbi:CHAT domain-containing protein [Pedobacter xixiisoli]|uniref:CHAT domain-containing protein n=1 Tax=Pedobacter xixiisoli TaxID=1476464 RepID=A0A285ZZT7_9SPHI|nr:CHAT domain-containing tetratricopeptide repeat protein [Pedobacter xixiisoli]SOD15172.1 CHAT domain-containing protein [Pedobacter xixiisoli]